MKNFPWLKNYPKGVAHEINPDHHKSLVDLVEVAFEKYKDLVAFENLGKSLNYKEVQEMSNHFAAYLQNDLKLKKGDRIALMMPNLLQYPIAIFGALKAGLIVVNTNPLYTAREMQHQLKDAEVDVIVILKNFAHVLEKVLPNTNIKHVITTSIGDLLGTAKGAVVNFMVKYVKKMIPNYNIPTAISFKSCLKEGAKSSFKEVPINNDDIAFLQYTGGTTGLAKGAMLTHRNIQANLEQILEWIKGDMSPTKEVCITALPLYHIFALTVNLFTFVKYGSKNILITNPRDISGFIKELKKHKFSCLSGVNTLFNHLLSNPNFKEIDFSHLKVSLGGGMAVQNHVAKKWKETTNNPIVEAYGLTETSPGASCNPINGTERIGTIGLPLPSTEFKLIDDAGNVLGVDEIGEILVKGPQVMTGYWNKSKETEEVLKDGWLYTGDMGKMDEDGFFKVVDRKKEMINVSGFNVYPNEVEDVLTSHPEILEAGVIGIPNKKSNEVVKAYLVKKDKNSTLTPESVKKHCEEFMTRYKIPKEIVFVEELPKSNVGKILRRKLKEIDENSVE